MSNDNTKHGKCAYCRNRIISEKPRRTEDGLCCWQCWQLIPDDEAKGICNCGSNEIIYRKESDNLPSHVQMWWRDTICADCGTILKRERI